MSEFSENDCEKRKNRKRKKSVLMNARKYAKQGKFGRGSRLSEDQYQYFVRTLELWKEGFENEELKVIFVNNVLKETENNEINYSSNQIGCRVIETLLPYAEYDILDKYITAFSDGLRVYCTDRFASHVLQCLLKISCKKSLTDQNEEIKNKYKKFTIKVSNFLLNNLEDFISDTYANHIMRSVFESLANINENESKQGIQQKNKNDNKKSIEKEENNIELEIPDEYTNIINEYGTRLISWPHFKDLPYNEYSSGLLQILLISLKKINFKLYKKMMKKLIEESFSPCTIKNQTEDNNLPDLFSSKPATMLLETTITTATPKLFTNIFEKCFKGRLAILSKMKGCNFSVQKLLSSCSEKEEFEIMFDELSNSFYDILVCNYTGVILAIAETCKRLNVKQGNFIQSLLCGLHCAEPRENEINLVPTTIHLVPYERLESLRKQNQYFVNLHGSVIIQIMLEFKKPIKVVNSLLNMDPNELRKLFCDIKGSHIVDVFVQSQYVGEKNKEKLVYKLMGTYQELATSKYGSRSFETIWSAAHLKQKTKIMEELCYKDGLWVNSEYGKIIANKIYFHIFKRNKNEWAALMEKSTKTKTLFADIINE